MIYFKIGQNTRLGNWMFQYAAAISCDENVSAVVDSKDFAKKVTKYDFFKDLKCRADVPTNAIVYKEGRFRYDPIPYKPGGDMMLYGFYQSPKYFDVNRVRSAFCMSEERRLRLLSKFSNELGLEDVTAIHVRRGDYLDNLPFHPFVGKRFFQRAIGCLSTVKNFIVCSDDIPWCRKFFPKAFPDRNFFFSDNDNPLDDMYLCSLCKNNIISNSSFGWWGAWLNDNSQKKIYAPSRWFGFAYERKGVDWRDIYSDEMTVVDNGYTLSELIHGHVSLWWRNFKFWAYPVYAFFFK